MASITVPDDALILDTDMKLTTSVLQEVAAYRDPVGRSVFGIMRYVSLYKIDTAQDIDPYEANDIVSFVPGLGLVQHCLAPPSGAKVWTASAAQGLLKGRTAKAHADLVGYPGGSMLSYDNEDCDGDVAGEIGAWVNEIATRPPLLYTGFSPGLTPDGLWRLPTIHCYWGAAGYWGPTHCGVAMRQHYPPIKIGGVEFDWNVAKADKMGRRILLATAA